LPREKGQGLLEYGLILVLVAVVVVAALALVGPPIAAALQKVVDGLK
jgi:pilus assembly protein Flp/PilA